MYVCMCVCMCMCMYVHVYAGVHTQCFLFYRTKTNAGTDFNPTEAYASEGTESPDVDSATGV